MPDASTPTTTPTSTALHELVLTRLIKVPRHKLFRCWTEPALIVQWFTPPPWKTVAAEMNVRAGGASLITMQGPDHRPVGGAGGHALTLARQAVDNHCMNPPAIDLSALRKSLGWLTEALMLWHAQPLGSVLKPHLRSAMIQ